MGRFEMHSHTHYSNLRLLDCINTPEKLVKRAYELGLAGIAITDHECLSSAVDIDKLITKYQEIDKNFKIARGNEIYLTDTRDTEQKYWHFILIAKDKIGHKMLRELSSNSWINSYFDRGMERVPTLKSELKDIIKKYGKGHLISSSGCLGSEIDHYILELYYNRQNNNIETATQYYNKILSFIDFCKSLFEDDFYLETQPAVSEEQIIVNNMMVNIGKATNTKLVITTDAHYLAKEDRIIHKTYLNSKEGAREVDSFYEFAYLQSTEEIIENIKDTNLNYEELEKNTLEVYEKIENYTLAKNQSVQQPKVEKRYCEKVGYEHLDKLCESENDIDRYWVSYCIDKLKELNKFNDTYLSRLNYEADIKLTVGKRLGTNMFAYPVFLQQMINLFWECGSAVGAGRGSAGAGLNHYLLGITQVDPIECNLPFWRYMNHDTKELGDIDIDLCPSKRELIFSKIREERGQLGCVQVCTFSTESTKSAIQTACRGYRSKDFPNGIDVDISQYLSSLVPQERGNLWSINDVVDGNTDKGRSPINAFIKEVNKYPGLLNIIKSIEGLIKNRSIHASGVNFYGEDPYETACFMKATNGSIITQYSLHSCEFCGDVKYDLLVTEEMDIITQCIEILQDNGYIEKNLTLREAYDKYIHPDKLPLKDNKLWDTIDSGDTLALFQLTSSVGNNMVKRLKPRNIEELTACNALIRLMPEGLNEMPGDRYLRFKADINQWYAEMDMCNLTKQEQKVLEKYCLKDYGVPSSQEAAMLIFMDEDICGFSLSEANDARRIISKKKMDKIPLLREKVITKAKSKALGEYVWSKIIALQVGYSFSLVHGFTYSLIACQAAYLSAYFPSICWNTAYLRVISGLGSDESSNYGKIAKGVGEIINHGIAVSLIDINKSDYMFTPDIENNSILFGMKALNGVNGEIIKEIIANRPYNSLKDFMEKVPCNKTVMISLIKAGAFDKFKERSEVMEEYIWAVCEPKKRITMQNFNMLSEYDLLPEELSFEKRIFVFNKALKKYCKTKNGYLLKDNFYDFYAEFYDIDELLPIDGELYISELRWKVKYDEAMLKAKSYLTAHKEELLEKLNQKLFDLCWQKYATGSYSAWEMESLGFYYHEHELIHLRKDLYNIVDFNSLPENPIVEKLFKKGGRQFPIYSTCRICGTVIAKDDLKSTFSILTCDSGVVPVKMSRDYYSRVNKQISEVGADGVKHVVDKSWLQKGTLVVVNGFRRGNTFITKKYKNTASHQFYKISNLYEDGTIDMINERAGEENE